LAGNSARELHRSIGKETAMLVGPGLGVDSGVQGFMTELLSKELIPLVVDADGLKLLSGIDEWWRKIPEESILTPHPGEMSILTGVEISEIQENRIEIAEHYAKKWGHVVVLKGAFTVVAEPGGMTAILPVASPALARAGTGDVLAGMITGLRAQGASPFPISW
jgi:NAD(P)H-hydrate epimerase